LKQLAIISFLAALLKAEKLETEKLEAKKLEVKVCYNGLSLKHNLQMHDIEI
jgi:hypothetical protein